MQHTRPDGTEILGYFDFTSWIDSKLEDISFEEARKKKIKDFQKKEI